jgi:hypothetical protein
MLLDHLVTIATNAVSDDPRAGGRSYPLVTA